MFQNKYVRIFSVLAGIVIPVIVAISVFFIFPDTQILCNDKRLGQVRYDLETGIFGNQIRMKTASSAWQNWCPEQENSGLQLMANKSIQKLSFGRGSASCQMSKKNWYGKLVWGTMKVDFATPQWNFTYRFADFGQEYVDSQPGGREHASCSIVTPTP